jgi:hypothetical protein
MTTSAVVIFTMVTVIYISLPIVCGYAIKENQQYILSRVLVAVLGSLGMVVYAFFVLSTFFPATIMIGTLGLPILIVALLGSLVIYIILYSFGEFLYNDTHQAKN